MGVSIELGLARVVDALDTAADDGRCEQMTVLIKTFERPAVFRRLVQSIRRLYPSLPIVVADDSREPIRLSGVETVSLPYDSGIAAGRNAGLDRATTTSSSTVARAWERRCG